MILRKYITAGLILLVICSCKKSFLDVTNTTQLYRQIYVNDLSSLEQFKNGIYVIINNQYGNGVGAAYPEVVADNLKPLAVGSQALLPQYSWAQVPYDGADPTVQETSTSMNGVWTPCYLIARACNFVIEEIDKYKSENPSKADNMKGEALAIRALMHYRLVSTFAQPYKFTADASHTGVPYITTSDITDPVSRQSVAEVYNSMIEDLKAAISLLPATITDTKYINVAAAKALLARIYLFKEDYAQAKSIAMEICDQFPLMTVAQGYPNGLFVEKLPSQSEILYRFTPVTQPGVVSVFLGARLRGSTLLYNATGEIATILTENGNDIRRNWVLNNSGTWSVTKFPEGVTPELNLTLALLQIAYFHPVLRSSEMFLTVAEAAAKTGDENTARTYLDAIRKRADPAIASLSASGQSLIDSIYKERRKELCFEEIRLFDLLRWKAGVHRIDALTGVPKDLPFPSEKAISPIPLRDVKLAGLSQNPGY